MENLKNIWPKVADLASDLGVPYSTAHSWCVRGRVPASRDFDLIAAAKRRGHKLTLEELALSRCAQREGNAA